MRTEEEIRAEIIEQLAALEHEQWCAWAQVLAKEEDYLSSERIKRWTSLFGPYANLTEVQKEQDRIWARKAFRICMQTARILNDKGEK
jgi:hypothetical protein